MNSEECVNSFTHSAGEISYLLSLSGGQILSTSFFKTIAAVLFLIQTTGKMHIKHHQEGF